MPIRFRPYQVKDRSDFVACFGDAELMAHLDGPMSAPAACALFESILSGTSRRVLAAWAIDNSRGEFIGHAALLRMEGQDEVEIGVILQRRVWGKGYGTAAMQWLREKALERGISTLVATVDLDNLASRRTLEKAGFSYEGTHSDEEGEYALYIGATGIYLPELRKGPRYRSSGNRRCPGIAL